MMPENSEVLIRDFRSGDLQQVAALFADAFREDYQKVVNLPQEKIANFLIETGGVFPLPFGGYVIAERSGQILGVMMLTWHRQERPRNRFRLSPALRYGLRTALKLFVERFLFPEKPRKNACHVEAIAVRSDARNRGIGATLLDYGKEIAAGRGLEIYTLHVDAANERAYGLYRKQGFRVIKKHKSLLARWLFGLKEWYFMSQFIAPPENGEN